MDKYQISTKGYHELSQLWDLPRTYTLERSQKEITEKYDIFSTPGSNMGAQVSLINELQHDIQLRSFGNKIMVHRIFNSMFHIS